jgi:hypothetical protein
MNKVSGLVALASAAILAAACSDMTTNPVSSSLASAALVSAPIGFDQINTSFVGGAIGSSGFVPGEFESEGDGFGGEGGGHHEHRGGGPGWDNLMGGGIADAFAGRIGFGHGGRGPFGDLGASSSCVFSSTDNRLTCPAATNRGLTINRSFAYLDASGAVQQLFDTATTNSVNVQTSVTGTTVHHHNDTSTVNSSSDFTVVGLASGSTQRTVNGTTSGTESTSGTDSAGVAFTAVRVAGDTVSGVIIPIENGKATYPTAGTVVRSMQATVTLSGQTPSTSTRREVITFNGTDTATIEVTQDGVTKTGTVSLHEGGLTCH